MRGGGVKGLRFGFVICEVVGEVVGDILIGTSVGETVGGVVGLIIGMQSYLSTRVYSEL